MVKLRRRGFEAEEIAAARARLLELGYLDDSAYASALVSSRSGSRGAAAIASELFAKGVGREAAGEALAGLDEEAEIEAAARLAGSRLRGLEQPSAPDLARVAGLLRRRGYSERVVRRVLRPDRLV